MQHIALAGAHTSSYIMALNLLKHLKSEVKLYLLTNNDIQLNEEFSESIYGDDPGHFIVWQTGFSFSSNIHSNEAMFAHYLKDEWDKAMKLYAENIIFITAGLKSIRQESNDTDILFTDGTNISVQKIILHAGSSDLKTQIINIFTENRWIDRQNEDITILADGCILNEDSRPSTTLYTLQLKSNELQQVRMVPSISTQCYLLAKIASSVNRKEVQLT